jgi:hypothetical protein
MRNHPSLVSLIFVSSFFFTGIRPSPFAAHTYARSAELKTTPGAQIRECYMLSVASV